MRVEHDRAEDDRLKARAAWVSIAANGVLIAFKLVVGVISGSIGIISEAVHSATDLVAAVIALVSVRQAARPADRRHLYGHEKVENLSGVIEGGIIFAAGVAIVVEAVQHLISGETLAHIPLAIAVMLVSAAVNIGLTAYLSAAAPAPAAASGALASALAAFADAILLAEPPEKPGSKLQ